MARGYRDEDQRYDESGNEPVTVSVSAICVFESAGALKVVLHPKKGLDQDEVWIPKSVVHADSEVYDSKENNEGKLVLKRWFADKEGLEEV